MNKEIWNERMQNLFRRRAKGSSSTPDKVIGNYRGHVNKCFIGKTVLDVGCGSMHLRGLMPEGIKYIGLDAFPVSDEVVSADIESYVPDEEIETVYCFAVLDGVHNITQTLENIQRIAKKNIVILTGINIKPDEYHTYEITESMLIGAFTKFKVSYKEYLAPKVILIEFTRCE